MVKMGGPVRKLASFVYESELNDGQKQTNIEKKNYYIPLEITPETIITEEYRNSEVHWSKSVAVRSVLF